MFLEHLKKNVYSAVVGYSFVCDNLVLFVDSIFQIFDFLYFGGNPVVLSITEKSILKCPTMIVALTISPCSSVRFFFMCFKTLQLLGGVPTVFSKF